MGDERSSRRRMSAAAPLEAYTPEQKRLLVVAVVPVFMALLGVSMVAVVLPSIERTMAAGTSSMQWILTSYALTFGVVLVAAGRAGDLWGRGRLFIAGLIVFGLSSLAAGIASDPVTLSIARAVTGVSAGMLNPQTVGFLQQHFSGAQRGRAFGLYGGVVGIAVAIGPVLGGGLIAVLGPELGWRISFLVNVPIAIAGIVGAVRWFPASAWSGSAQAAAEAGSSPDAASPAAAGISPKARSAAGGGSGAARGESGPVRNRRRVSALRDLDPVGAALLGLGTLAVMLPFVESRAFGPIVWLCLPIAGALIAVWALWEQRVAARGGAPMVDLAVFRIRSFTSGSLVAGLYFLGMTSIWIVVAVYAQTALGLSALLTGLLGVPSAIAGAITSPWAGRRVTGAGRRIVAVGIAVAVAGMVAAIIGLLAFEDQPIGVWWLMLALTVVGAGQGLVISPNQALTLAEVPVAYAGAAGGVLQTAQRVGTSVGIAMVTGVTFGAAAASGWTLGLVAGFAAIVVCFLAAGVVALVDLRRSRTA